MRLLNNSLGGSEWKINTKIHVPYCLLHNTGCGSERTAGGSLTWFPTIAAVRPFLLQIAMDTPPTQLPYHHGNCLSLVWDLVLNMRIFLSSL
jgi:hypothetical protein